MSHLPTCRGFASLTLCAAALLSLAGPASADTITYRLSSHPDGSEAPPAYGLRLDDLDSDNSNTVWLFDFDHTNGTQSSAMFLDWDTSTNDIHIYGTTWGGRDTSRNGTLDSTTTDWWTIDFSYAGGNGTTSTSPDPDGVTFTGNEATLGSIANSDSSITRSLTDWPNSGNSFNFLNQTHRGVTPTNGQMNGWGWLGFVIDETKALGHSDRYFHTSYQDWLFTATPVPEPGSVALVGLGLAGVAAARRRRAKGERAPTA